MPSIKVQKNSSLTPAESFKRMTNLLENDHDLKKLDAKYKCEFNDKDLSGKADGSMFKAQMKVTPDGAGSAVQIDVELPFALALMKGMIQKTMQKKLEEALT